MSEQGWQSAVVTIIAVGVLVCFLIFANSPAGFRWGHARLCERVEHDGSIGPDSGAVAP